ncbi:MAG: CehA/McbA family metallohydrolase [Firmicutes bacterium]|nr:CehA/McbA family metallohydrolase [Bacillota bacterium]
MFFTYTGNIHIHTRHSDGTGTIAEITAHAAAAGLHYIIITDHETLAGLPEEGLRHGVVVLVGAELNRESHHYLALGLKQLVPGSTAHPQQMVDEVRRAGALGFMAHPFEKGSPYIDGGKAYPWKRFPDSGFTGLEIWNYSSHWRGRATSIPRTLYWFFLNRKAALDRPPPEGLALWDRYTGSGLRVTAIGSSDAHATKIRVGFLSFEIFPYPFLFRTINTHLCLREVLSNNFSEAKGQIYDALAEGRCFVSFDQLHPGTGFSFCAWQHRAGVAAAIMGEEIRWQEGLQLTVRSPSRRSEIRIIKDGALHCRDRGPEFHCPAPGPGVYRAEVYYRPFCGKARPWIYANPIYIRP